MNADTSYKARTPSGNGATLALDSASYTARTIGTFARYRANLKSKLSRYWRWIAATGVALSAAVTVMVIAGPTAANIPELPLATAPLYTATAGDIPTLALALSVEFPTVGAQYVNQASGSEDSSYADTKEYLGYYDARGCYTYNNTPTETPAAGLTTADYKRFDRTANAIVTTATVVVSSVNTIATSVKCSNAFSGNFLNWSTSSAIDMMRLALSGGDRYIDTPDLTILQRAVLPNGDPTCMWNNNYFPAKKLVKDGAGVGTYFGAIPNAMITQAAGRDVWVANTLNQIYFGTTNTGGGCNSNNRNAYTLGAPVAVPKVGTLLTASGTALPSEATQCAIENEMCNFAGTKEVWYGNGTNWTYGLIDDGVSCSNSVFGDPAFNVGKSCHTRPYTGTPRSGPNVLNSEGFFYSRVSVCNSANSALQDARDFDFCFQYPNGKFKPTGNIQKYSDQLRIAAFGYLMDQTASYNSGGRYGGVLRAPMKYVGLKTFDINGVENTPAGGNPNIEWNTATGVFTANPDNDTTQTPAISGVINYLNRFGRTGPVPGRYKQYDPVGELYYETLRYMQGLPPTTASVSSITSGMYDGFPVSTTWTDPFGGGRSSTGDYSCSKNNIVVVGDVNTHDGSRWPSANVAANVPNFSYWTGIVQNFERNNSVAYLDGQGVSRTTGNPNATNSNGLDRIVGTAYWAHMKDIRGADWSEATLRRPGLRVKSFFFDVNENAASNSTNYRQNRNKFFTAAKYGGYRSTASIKDPNLPFNPNGNPFKDKDGNNNNNVWQKPAEPGEAGAFYLQSSARGVLNAFSSIFEEAKNEGKSIAGVAVASKNFSTVGTNIFQAGFKSGDWTGDVESIPISISSTNVVTVGAVPNWSAAARLNAMSAPATTRKIFVGAEGATASPAATAFTWADIGPSLKTQLAKLTPASVPDALGQDRLNYLRGDGSKEGSPFRTRNKLLGDVVNSGVTYSGTPTVLVNAGNGYDAFFTANQSRTPAVFVGANDGMMHAFNANTGDEMFGYIPSWMGPKLAALTDNSYAANHQNYVDATPYVAEARVGMSETDSGASWKTVLVSGTGGGGKGVFALDVTNPSTFAASNVMWEFTQNDDVDMGFVVGKPQIMRVRTSAPNASPAVYRWFALVTSGVNNYVGANSSGTFSDGNPALFLLALDKPAGTAWTATGSAPNYYKVVLPIDATLSLTKPTGAVNFRATFGSYSELAAVYVGDLHGRLWKLNFAGFASTDWNIAKLSPYKKGGSAPFTPLPLYIAKTSSGDTQPISMAPSVVAGPLVAGLPTAYVAFGTGQYLRVSDKTTTNPQSFYAIHDDGTATSDSTSTLRESVVSSRLRLQSATVNLSAESVVVPAFVWGKPMTDADTTQRSGWFFDYTVSGERQVSNATVVGDNVIFGSLIPAASGAGTSCAAVGGTGYQYSVNIDTGAGQTKVSNVGLLGEIFTIEGSAKYGGPSGTGDTRNTGRRTKIVQTPIIQQGQLGVASSGQSATTTFVAGRLSWRQINNYQDLKTN